MAISRSPDWSVASIKSCRKPHKIIVFTPSWKTLPFLSLPCFSNLSLFQLNASSCPSPILEEPSTNFPVIQLDFRVQNSQEYQIPDSKSLNKFLCGILRDPRTEHLAYEYYKKATERQEFRPDKPMLKLLIRYLMQSKNWDLILPVADDFNKYNVLPDSNTCSRLVYSCIKTRKFRIVESLLECFKCYSEIPVLAFDSAMRGYNKLHMYSSTISVYEKMKAAGIFMDSGGYCHIMKAYQKIGNTGKVTYASIINAYCRTGLYSKAEMVFLEMQGKGFDKCVVAYSSIVAMYGKTGRTRDAMRLVAKMKVKGCEPNVWIYNSLLDMHGRVKNLRQVEKLWKEMKRRKVAPDKVTYTSVIAAYNKAKEFETCVRYYHEYRFNGGVIDKAVAGVMVGVFSKIGRIDELLKLLQDIKTEGTQLDGRLYRSAFNALRDAGLQMQAKWMQESFEAI
ncbi:pentatricopeptide repeat-containing protein, putative [Ricinus communis]|uniref:Pentatricopeptide repeat-containing protein, putative n=1 Tax=Ricinus communis TaxID=3988 RepID=B9S796_RICCO|nr:pentatricopeptide repeat-containing protein, putative [Ricinus communis]